MVGKLKLNYVYLLLYLLDYEINTVFDKLFTMIDLLCIYVNTIEENSLKLLQSNVMNIVNIKYYLIVY